MYLALQLYLAVGAVMAVRVGYLIKPAKFRDLTDACAFTIALIIFALFWPMSFFSDGGRR